MREIYFDNAATTKVDEKVVKAMLQYFTEKYGNASSQHEKGREAYMALEKSREIIAKSINADNKEIYFTSGGTESDNWALKGIFFENKKTGKNHIITTKIEHDSTLKTCEWLQTQGAEITYLDVDREGFIDLEQLKNSITEKTILVSIIHGNNEIGTIQDLKKIGQICKEKNVLFHTDACQSFTKEPLNMRKQYLDLITINAHKIYGPKGVGALIVRKGVKITPLLHGGGHESGMRSGTENVPGIIGFAKAAELMRQKNVLYMKRLRDKLIKKVLRIKGTRLNGHPKKRLCNNVNIIFHGVEGEALLLRLDSHGIMCSTGSACSSNSLKPSHVLTAMGLKPEQAHSSIRFSVGKQNTLNEINYVVKVLEKEVKSLRKISMVK